MTATAAPGAVKLRPFLFYRLVLFFPLTVIVVWTALGFGRGWGPSLWFLIEWVFVGLFTLITQSWFGANLTSAELVINSIRRRRVAWAEVQAVTIQPFEPPRGRR